MRIAYFGAGRPFPKGRLARLRPLIAAACVAAVFGVALQSGIVAEDRPAAGAGPPRPDPGGVVLTVAISADPTRLDPHDASDAPSSMVNFHIYDRLVELDERMEPVPSLATSWSRNERGDVWRIELRPGVYFHDGSRLSAAVVKENFDRLLDPALGLARRSVVAGFVREVAAVGELTLEIRLTGPVAPFLKILAHDSLGIVASRSLRASSGPFVPVGTGPFRLAEWTPGARLVLEAFDAHWRGKPNVDRIEFVTVPAGSSRAILLEAGEVHVAFPIEPAHAARLSRSPGVELETAATQRLVYLAFNLDRPPFDDVLVRRAVSQAIDKEKIAQYVLFGMASPAWTAVAEGTWGYADVPAPGFDPRAAAEAIEARVAPGERRTVALWSPAGRYPQERAVAQAVGAYLSEAGLDVEIRLFEWGAYLSRLRRSDEWDLALLGWVPSTGDADMALRPLFMSGSRSNYTGYASEEADRMIEAAAREPDPERRRAIYRNVLEHLAREMPIVPLYSPRLAYGRQARVRGIRLHSTETVDFRFVTIDGVGA